MLKVAFYDAKAYDKRFEHYGGRITCSSLSGNQTNEDTELAKGDGYVFVNDNVNRGDRQTV